MGGVPGNVKKPDASGSAQAEGRAGTRKARRTPRRVFNRPIGILCQGAFSIVQATQLSEGGLGFLSEDAFPANSKIVISLLLPDGEVVVTRGEILPPHQDAEPGHCAAKFLGMSLQLRRLIRNYVTAKTAAEAEIEAVAKKKNDAA